ncbi:hypothetical protein BC940DRAFT_320484 [Gongronella butleri]|nr:hypothetical protein BC940DRAFT_320484 [Gongronella butleri]
MQQTHEDDDDDLAATDGTATGELRFALPPPAMLNEYQAYRRAKKRILKDSATWRETPFKMATFCTIISTFLHVRALVSGTLCVLHSFYERTQHVMAVNDAGGASVALLFLASGGFLVDYLLGTPRSRRSTVVKLLVLPSVLTCTVLVGGSLVLMHVEQWEYNQALIFCTTALTTIGYGDVVPRTVAGRLFFFAYATGGVCVVAYFFLSLRSVIIHVKNAGPLMKVRLMRVESLMDDYYHAQQEALQLKLNMGLTPASSIMGTSTNNSLKADNDDNAHRSSSSLLQLLFNDERRPTWVQIMPRSGAWRMAGIWAFAWIVGSAVFCFLEDEWNYIDALYFTFATQLTVGFGDLVPQAPLAQEFWFVYIIISIAVVAYFTSLFGDVLAEKLLNFDDEGDRAGDTDIEDDADTYSVLSKSSDACETSAPAPILQPSTSHHNDATNDTHMAPSAMTSANTSLPRSYGSVTPRTPTTPPPQTYKASKYPAIAIANYK